MSSVVETHTDIVPRLEAASERMQRAHKAAASVIFGQDEVIERTLVTILSGGHALLIGVPGLAKTLLVETLGKVLGLDAKRIQFTPDLMPSDIIGSEVLEDEPGRGRSLPLRQGTDLHPASDGRRDQPRHRRRRSRRCCRRCRSITSRSPASATTCRRRSTCSRRRTRSSRRAPIRCPKRSSTASCLQIDVGYPDLVAERRMLFATTGNETPKLEAVSHGAGADGDPAPRAPDPRSRQGRRGDPEARALGAARHRRRRETDRFVAWGPGPRASQALMLAVRAKALIDGRLAPSVDDVIALAEPVLKHRMALTFAARAEGEDLSGIIARLAAAVE